LILPLKGEEIGRIILPLEGEEKKLAMTENVPYFVEK
jgi:hypothetical protein